MFSKIFSKVTGNSEEVQVQELDKSRVEEKLGEFQSLVASDPHNPDIRYELGEFYYQQGEVDKAVSEYKKVLEMDSSYGQAYAKLGECYYLKKNLENALLQYEALVKLCPEDYVACYRAGRLFFETGDPDRAVVYLRESGS